MKAWKILAPQIAWFLLGEVHREVEKGIVFRRARDKADELGLPLVNYGCSYRFVHESDYNLDVVPRDVPRFILVSSDTERLPFEDKSVCVFCSHVLEHTHNPRWLMREFNRISDYVFIVTPSPLFPQTYLHPDHKWIVLRGTNGLEFHRNAPKAWWILLLGINFALLLI